MSPRLRSRQRGAIGLTAALTLGLAAVAHTHHVELHALLVQDAAQTTIEIGRARSLREHDNAHRRGFDRLNRRRSRSGHASTP